jgi:hypothetical protein
MMVRVGSFVVLPLRARANLYRLALVSKDRLQIPSAEFLKRRNKARLRVAHVD